MPKKLHLYIRNLPFYNEVWIQYHQNSNGSWPLIYSTKSTVTIRNVEHVRAGRDFRDHLIQPTYVIIEIICMTVFPNPGLQNSACWWQSLYCPEPNQKNERV